MSVNPAPRALPDRLGSRLSSFVYSWEGLLIVVAIGIFIFNSFASPYFLDPWNLSDATFSFTEKALISLAMAMLIISGEIDLSVASIAALSSTAMGFLAVSGYGTPAIVAAGLATGLACGAFNGLLVTRFGLPSIVVTIGTMSLFRGLSLSILQEGVYKGYPASFSWFGQGYVYWVFSFEFVFFLLASLVFGIILHKTSFGRTIYAIGNNAVAAQFSGIRVTRVKFILFLLTGLMSGLASVLLTARIGSTRPSIATGWELEAITMAVLGGVNILGGSGTIPGVVIAAFIMGMVTFGFGLLNVPGIVMSIFIGFLLITVIAAPILYRRYKGQ
jgi:rhamnose transport system permease protein